MGRGLRRWCGGVVLACSLVAAAWAQDGPDFVMRALERFDAADRVAQPPPGGVLFVGSSSIAFWPDLAAEFDEYPVVIQRGIAGSRMADLARHADRLAIRYRPSRIVVYAGENDVAGGASPRDVLESLQAFVRRVRMALPGSWIAWVSIKPSPSRWASEAGFRETNALVSAWIAEQPDMAFIDLRPRMFGVDGRPLAELYAPDGLHFSAAGYALCEEIIEARLRLAPTADR